MNCLIIVLIDLYSSTNRLNQTTLELMIKNSSSLRMLITKLQLAVDVNLVASAFHF